MAGTYDKYISWKKNKILEAAQADNCLQVATCTVAMVN
jgi:hypothetical protein